VAAIERSSRIRATAAGNVDTGEPVDNWPPIVEPTCFVEEPLTAVPSFRRALDTHSASPAEKSAPAEVPRKETMPVKFPVLDEPVVEILSPAESSASPRSSARPPRGIATFMRGIQVRAVIVAGCVLLVVLAINVIERTGNPLKRTSPPARSVVAAIPARMDPPLDCFPFAASSPRQACEQANAGNAQAQVSTGLAYTTGNDVPVDYEIAFRLFRLAADQGNAPGQTYLGTLYLSGHGVTQNTAEAVRLFRLAVDQDDPAAEVDLGDLYVTGKGVPKDDAEATRLYRLAANQGNVEGMNSFAWRLAMGGSNLNEALNWASRAAAAQPKNGAAEDTLAWIFYLQGKPELALQHALRAVALVPRCASCEDHLGDIYAAVGETSKAAIHWRRALDFSVGQPPDPDWNRAAVKKKLSSP